MPYTIVLTPPPEQAAKYVEASQLLYRNCEPSYLLTNDGSSSPHITVVQFNCESDEVAQEVWFSMCAKMKEEGFAPFSPPFIGVAFVEGVGIYKGTTWVELSVQRGDEKSPILKVHQAALEVLKSFNLEPLNASGSHYRPHLTLARIVLPQTLRAWPQSLFENIGAFNLELGLSDEKWQYAKTLSTFSFFSR